jgi:hypothetical protein
MPVTKDTANALLAEFMAKRGSVPRYRKGHSGKALPMIPDKLEKAEFEPDNSRIGLQSYGMQSRSQISALLDQGSIPDADSMARMMVREYFDLKRGILPQYARISFTLIPVTTYVPRGTIGCVREPLTLGCDHWRKAYTCAGSVEPEVIQPSNPIGEAQSWRNLRVPKNGQRPIVRTR